MRGQWGHSLRWKVFFNIKFDGKQDCDRVMKMSSKMNCHLESVLS